MPPETVCEHERALQQQYARENEITERVRNAMRVRQVVQIQPDGTRLVLNIVRVFHAGLHDGVIVEVA